MGTEKELLTRAVESIYPSREELQQTLSSGKKLKIYLGIDPTSPEIHLGHTIVLRKLRAFQDLGHKIILLFGDFTGMIGDPTGRTSEREPLTREQVSSNSKAYKEQAEKILDFEKNPAEIVYNSTWWDKTNTRDLFEILSQFTTAQLLERDMFQERMKAKKPISASELLYPILQGYDSVSMDIDMEIGATDQTFNMLVGRGLLKTYKKREKFVLTTPLLEGNDGRKMGKSFGNTISLNSSPEDMYGKVMSIKDDLIFKYLTLLTDMPIEKIEDLEDSVKNGKTNPMEAKKLLALEIVAMYHGEEKSKEAAEEFKRVIQEGERTSNIEETTMQKSSLPMSFAALSAASGATQSISEAIRLAESKGLKVDDKLITNPREVFDKPLKAGTIIDVGKRKSVKVIWEDK